jgi:hypothetical protein
VCAQHVQYHIIVLIFRRQKPFSAHKAFCVHPQGTHIKRKSAHQEAFVIKTPKTHVLKGLGVALALYIQLYISPTISVLDKPATKAITVVLGRQMHIFPYVQEGVTVKTGTNFHVQLRFTASKVQIQQYYAYQVSTLGLLDKILAQLVQLGICVLAVGILYK